MSDALLTAASKLAYANPFLPERMALEQEILGSEFIEGSAVWSASVTDPEAASPNIAAIYQKLSAQIPRWQKQHSGTTAFEESVHYLLYQRYYASFVSARGKFGFYRDFLADWNELLGGSSTALDPAHVFACFWQIQRAFHHIYDNIIGSSLPAARLRASVWQSIFTHDMRRYRRSLYRKLPEFPTLITGPSGTGKELIARAIAGSRYIPFDAQRKQFVEASALEFWPINLAALSPTLVESELFGHKRGSFTGAIGDRKGWLESCSPLGSVFLDELGETDSLIQVKLLRVLETRQFSAVGDTRTIPFHGKLIAATNRDLPAEIRAGRFREDLYYRLCADLIQTPPLSSQIQDSPAAFDDLLHYMVTRTVGSEQASECLPEVKRWISKNLPADYSWPGNYRELEQCVRNIIIRRSYKPLETVRREDGWVDGYRAGNLTADELLSQYAAHVYQLTGSYEEAARRLMLDRRTVKAKVEAFLKRASSKT